jgi:CBS-domain-containing membrane protein
VLAGDGRETVHRSQLAAVASIGAIMSRDVLCVRPDVSVDALAALLTAHGQCGAPVVDDHRRLLGFVSLSDLMRDRVENGDTDESGPLRVPLPEGGEYRLGSGFHAEALAHNTIAAVMTSAPVTLSAEATIVEAAAVLASERIVALPVLDGQRRVLGVISAFDLMAWLSQKIRPPANEGGLLGRDTKFV